MEYAICMAVSVDDDELWLGYAALGVDFACVLAID